MEEALNANEYEKDNGKHTMILFEILQEYVFRNKIGKARELLDNRDLKKYRGLVLSKIASKLLVSGDTKQAIDFFKKAIRLEIKNGDITWEKSWMIM